MKETFTTQPVSKLASGLPAFNQTIEIKVEVSDIFEQLKSTFPADYKHSELVSHAIVGSAVTNGGLGAIYNALNGYSPNIDFEVGEMVECTQVSRSVRKQIPQDSDENPKYTYDHEAIGTCKIVEIDLYRSGDKVRVEYEEVTRYNDKSMTTHSWVSHKNCTKWAQPA